MRKYLNLLLLLLVMGSVLALAVTHHSRPVIVPTPNPTPTTTTSLVLGVTQSDQCDESLWAHIYNPTRLQVIAKCITVTGTIYSVKAEPDGDFHIQVQLDNQYEHLLNAKNRSDQLGKLVVEPVCLNPVKQADAEAACQGFKQQLTVPPVGTHVTIIGDYVLDVPHGWNEIHPVTHIDPL